jgi:hypothetical protein
MNIVAVISSYRKDLNWSKKLIGIVSKIYVYDHDNLLEVNNFILNNSNYHYERIPNKGCEGSGYLKYIIDNYYNLPDKIILIHDEEYSWHHSDSIIKQILDNINSNNMYINLNNYIWGSNNLNNDYIDQFRPGDNYYNLYVKLLQSYFGDIRDYEDFMYGNKGCAQFIIKKQCITKNNIQLYIDIYNYCMSDNVNYGHVPGGFGYFLEYTWIIIFGYVIPTKHLKGSWKYSSRFIHINNDIICAELGDGNGGWNKQSIPLNEEHLYSNYNGFFSK